MSWLIILAIANTLSSAMVVAWILAVVIPIVVGINSFLFMGVGLLMSVIVLLVWSKAAIDINSWLIKQYLKKKESK